MEAKRGEVDATITSADPFTKQNRTSCCRYIKATFKAKGESQASYDKERYITLTKGSLLYRLMSVKID